MTEQPYDLTYIDAVAMDIAGNTGDFYDDLDEDDKRLYRIYAVLALSTGVNTTLENVHDAWSAWKAGTDPNHRSLIWFESLAEDVRELDRPYAEAIQAAARVFKPGNAADEGSPEAKANHAYWERNQLVAFLSKVYPSYLGIDPDEPDWPVVFIETPEGQLSWHVNKGEAAFYFDHLRFDYAKQWDGHTSEEKYARLARLGDAATRGGK